MLCLFDRIAVLLVFFGFLLAALFEIEVNTVENDSSTQNRCIELAGSLQMTKINHDESSNGDHYVSNK